MYVRISSRRSGSIECKETQRQLNNINEKQMDYWNEKVQIPYLSVVMS